MDDEASEADEKEAEAAVKVPAITSANVAEHLVELLRYFGKHNMPVESGQMLSLLSKVRNLRCGREVQSSIPDSIQ